MNNAKLKTPFGNTGSNIQDTETTSHEELENRFAIGNDYLVFCVDFEEVGFFGDLCDFITDSLKDEMVFYPDRPIYRGRHYAGSGESVSGIRIAYTMPEGDTWGTAWFSIPAGSLRRVSPRDCWRMCVALYHHYKVRRVTRIDIALDDFNKALSYDQIMEAVEVGNYSGSRKVKPIREYDRVKGASEGWTIYFGSRQSDKLVRVYNKEAESKGLTRSHRIEVEFHDESAQNVWMAYAGLSSFDGVAELFKSLVVGAIDFIDRSVSDRACRCPRLQWWQEFVDAIGTEGIRLAKKSIQPSIERSVEWIQKQVEITLSMLREIWGASQFHVVLSNWIAEGKERYTKKHEAFVRVAKQELRELFESEEKVLFGVG